MDENYNMEYTLFYSSIPFLVIGFTGNVLVVRIVHKTREMHTPTNYLLVSMATSDIITILLWPLYFFEVCKFVCKLVELVELCIMVSYFTITVLAVERYHALLKPFRNWTALKRRQREEGDRLHLDRKHFYLSSGNFLLRMEHVP